MRAVVIPSFGGPNVLSLREWPLPEPSRGEVRVRVRATAVNHVDLLQRMGRYPGPTEAPPFIPGLEFAGEVDALGPGATGWKVGDRVFGLASAGTYAEAVAVPERTLAPLPENLSFVEAAAVPEVFITAYDAMFNQACLGPGEIVLISAVGGGVGTAALQLARAASVRTIGTDRTREKLEKPAALGLDHGVVPEGGRFADQVKALTAGQGVHAVLELVGGPYVSEDLACLAPRGRIVVVGLAAGHSVELDLGRVLKTRATILGFALREGPIEERMAVTQSFARHVVPLFAEGKVKPVVDRVLPLAEAASAHAYLESGEAAGKVVLDCG